MYRAARRYVYEVFAPNLGGRAGVATDWFIMLLIAANVAAVVVGTVDWVAARYGGLLSAFEVASVTVFTVEYLARVWSSIESGEYEGVVTGRLRFMSRPLPVIDLLAILPFYLTVIGVQIDLRVLRGLRLIRLFRLLKLARYSSAVASLGQVYRSEREKLVLAAFANVLLLVLASSVMYFIEHPHQPESFPSIPATFYWAMVTLTTVGYGDVTPVTGVGRITAGLIAFLGVGLFALPASILASGFIEQAQNTPDGDEGDGAAGADKSDGAAGSGGDAESADGDWEYCPHCGEPLEQ